MRTTCPNDLMRIVVFNDKNMTVHDGDSFFEDMKNYKRDTWSLRKPMM